MISFIINFCPGSINLNGAGWRYLKDPGDCKNYWFTQKWLTVYTEEVSYTDAAGVRGLQVVIGGRTYGPVNGFFTWGTDNWGGADGFSKLRQTYYLPCREGCHLLSRKGRNEAETCELEEPDMDSVRLPAYTCVGDESYGNQTAVDLF